MSVFSIKDVETAVYLNLVATQQPLLDRDGEHVAQKLVQQYGDQLKFVCQFGPELCVTTWSTAIFSKNLVGQTPLKSAT